MNEKDFKESVRGGVPVCSVTGDACVCLAGGGCKAREPHLDKASDSFIRGLRTARLYAQAAVYKLDDALGEEHLLVRRYPCPETRDIRRKLASAISMIAEVVG